jgi:hypothetical protein
MVTFLVYLSILAIVLFSFTLKKAIKKIGHKENTAIYSTIIIICCSVVVLTIVLLNQ